MVQIYRESRRPDALPEKPKKSTFSQQLSEGVGRGIDTALFFQRERKKAEFEKNEKKAMAKFVEQLYGDKDKDGNKINIADDMPLEAYGLLAKSGLERKSEKEKYEAKQKENEDFFNKYLGTDTEKQEEYLQNEEERIEKAKEREPELDQKIKIPKWQTMSDEEVASITARDPAKGKILKDLRTQLVQNQPIPPEQMEKMRDVRMSPDFDDLDEIGQYRAYTDAGVSPINAEREIKFKTPQLERKQKHLDKSYADQKDFIDSTTNKYNSFEIDMKPRLMAMQKLNEKELVTPTQEMFLEALGIPLGALDNPESELFQKLSQDLLKGLPETYGSRILKVEVDNFLKTIPTLGNSASARRMIASSLLKLGEIKEVYYKEMRKQQKMIENAQETYPRDFQQEVLDNVMPHITKINSEFQQISQLKDIPEETIPYINSFGTISFIPANDLKAIEWADKKGKRVW